MVSALPKDTKRHAALHFLRAHHLLAKLKKEWQGVAALTDDLAGTRPCR